MKFLGWLLRQWIIAVGATLRWRYDDPEGVAAHGPAQPLIIAFWHNRIFLMPALFRHHLHCGPRRQRVAVLVSASRDGAKLTTLLEQFDLVCVRGSSSRRGGQALVELTGLVQAGYHVGITPDGPRGPRYHAQPGAISLAVVTGAPILPLTWNIEHKIVLRRAWDHFILPVPFSRVVVRLGPLLRVPADADATTRENKRLELENILTTLSEP